MLDRCYLLIEEKMPFRDAQTRCVSMGAEVVTLKNKLQNEHLTDLIYNKWAKNVDVWLGGRRVHSFKTNGMKICSSSLLHHSFFTQIVTDYWLWTDFTEVQYFNWAPAQPNLNGAQYCIEMVRQHTINYQWPAGTWNDISCNEVNAVLCMASGPVQHLSARLTSANTMTESSDLTEDPPQSSIDVLVKAFISLLAIIMVLCFALFISRNYYLNFKFRFDKPKPNFGFRIERNKVISADKLDSSNVSLNSPSHSNC